MSITLKKFGTALTAGLLMVSCGKTDSTTATSPSASPSADPTGAPSVVPSPATGSLAVLPPDEVFATTQTSLASIANVKATDGQSSLYPGALAVSAGLVATEVDPSTVCKTSGNPKDEESGLQGNDRAKHVAKVAYCDMAMRPDGPDTTRGGIDRLQGFLCAVRDHLTYDGVKQDITLKFTTACFSETFASMVKKEMGTDEAAANVTSYSSVSAEKGNAEYSKLIEINLSSFDLSYTIQLKQTETMLAASAILEKATDSTTGDAIAIRLETGATGSIRYEGRFANGFNDGPGTRHLRVYATGSADPVTGAFSSVGNLQYLFQDVYKDNNAKVQTVTGSPTAGYKAILQNGTNFANWETFETAPPTFCYGGRDCAGNDGLKVSKADDEKFGRSLSFGDAAAKDVTAWFKAHGPLSFESVTFAGEQ